MNLPQTVNVIKALHKIIEFSDAKCFELVAKKFVQHFRKWFVDGKIDKAKKQYQSNVAYESLAVVG
jgi:hypothetical protein